jgi:hypothetical protein
MRTGVFVLLAGLAASAAAQQQEIQRALIQRDQQSAEFAAQLRGSQARGQLDTLHARQLGEALVPLSPDPALAAQLLPYQRSRMAEERELHFAPPVVRPAVSSIERPLPLPGGPRPGVDPVTPDSIGR